MSQHTPGPWSIGTHGDEIHANGHILATTHWSWVKGAFSHHAEANARLIAAAPDLLAALQDAVLLAEPFFPEIALAGYRAVIAKALGQTEDVTR